MTPQQAQIRRATRDAWQAVQQLDAAGRQRLQQSYAQAAADIRAQIDSLSGADGSVRLAQLQDLLQQVEARLQVLGAAGRSTMAAGLAQGAEYGAMAILGARSRVVSTAAQALADRAVQAVQSFVAADGLQLSDRLWRLDRGAREGVTQALEQGIIQGQSALDAARAFLARGEPVPGELAAKMGAAASSRLGDAAAAALTGEGGALHNAMRVFRTEMNRAHGTAYMIGGEDRADFAGWRFTLSPAHPQHDICDLLAAQNLYGLGPGVYPNRETCPWPAHPNTLSFVEIVFEEDVSAADRNGKETSMQALAKLPEEVRTGVLGKGKAEIYATGRLTQGMIRSRLRDVRARLDEG